MMKGSIAMKRKIMAAVLALCLLMALAAPAWAEEDLEALRRTNNREYDGEATVMWEDELGLPETEYYNTDHALIQKTSVIVDESAGELMQITELYDGDGALISIRKQPVEGNES